MSDSQSKSPDLNFKVNVDVESTRVPKFLNYDHIESWVRYLLGNVLTLMDASFPDPQQRKAVKDLVRKQFREHLKEVAQACELNRSINADPLT